MKAHLYRLVLGTLGRILSGFIAFVLYISLFAAIYAYGFKTDFQFTTADKEPDYLIGVSVFERLLEKKVFEPEFWNHQVKLDVKNIEIDNFNWPEFRLYAEVPIANTDKLYPEPWYCNLAILDGPANPEDNSLGIGDDDRIERYVTSEITCTKIGKNFAEWQVVSFNYRFQFADSEWQLLNEVRYPSKGISEGLFWRMFYFSAITATTLGYGEIVPLTDGARTVVTAQTISGLILMGVILWWITSRPSLNSQARNGEPAPDRAVLDVAQALRQTALEAARSEVQNEINEMRRQNQDLQRELSELRAARDEARND